MGILFFVYICDIFEDELSIGDALYVVGDMNAIYLDFSNDPRFVVNINVNPS